mgnify:FL=1
MGILIAIDGVDASGKQTQSELVFRRLTERGVKARLVSFPDYGSESSALVKMYLNGEFGSDPDDVNAYAASTFFAADRFASYRRSWKHDYDSGTVIIADRYVPSNMIHQASKLPGSEKGKFIEWLYELEYGIYALPKPDVTIFLDMPPEKAQELMEERKNKITHSEKKDIHERNAEYLIKSYENAVFVSQKMGWKRISCVINGELRSIYDINSEIMETVTALLKAK